MPAIHTDTFFDQTGPVQTPARPATTAAQLRRLSLFALIAGLGLSIASVQEASGQDGAGDRASDRAGDNRAFPPLRLTGVVRDFRDDHPDFQRRPKDENGRGQFGHYAGIVADELGPTGKPVYRSGGHRVLGQWTDDLGRNVTPKLESRAYLGDRPGESSGRVEGEGSAVTNAVTFSEWFRDVPGVNQSMGLALELVFDELTETWVFDDRASETYRQLGGFFPINDAGYGNYQNGTNFHFTFELDTEFVYDAEADMSFTFNGDDDVWVFIDGKLVIDLGGVHGQIEQTIDLDRLGLLEDGERYSLKFFFAERHTTESNFRIETNIPLRTIRAPQAAALYD